MSDQITSKFNDSQIQINNWRSLQYHIATMNLVSKRIKYQQTTDTNHPHPPRGKKKNSSSTKTKNNTTVV